MTIREAIKAQRKSLKNRSLKERISYFWEYYALRTFAGLIALIVLVAFIVTMVTKKEYAFTGMFFGGAVQESSEEYLSVFAKSAGIDEKKYQLSVQAGPDVRMDQMISPEIYQHMEAFTAMVAAKSVDCFTGNPELFLYYAYMEYAVDLRTVLSQAELETLSPYLYYVDAQLIKEQEASDGGYADAYIQCPDPTKPEIMKDPVPVAVSLEVASEDFHDAYQFIGTNLMGICASSEHSKNAQAFLRYALFGENPGME